MGTEIGQLTYRLDVNASTGAVQVKQVTDALQGAGKAANQAQSSFLGTFRDLTVSAQGAIAVVRTIARAIGAVVDASVKMESAMTGLSTVSRAFGVDTEAAKKAAMDLSSKGLLTVGEAAEGLKNLIPRMGLESAIKLMNGLTDAAAFNRQGTLSMGEAVVGATQGIKNQNCLKYDTPIHDPIRGETRTIQEWHDSGIVPAVYAYSKEFDNITVIQASHLHDNGIKIVFKLTLENGSSIESTDNHRYLTDSGFMFLSDIPTGKNVAVFNAENTQSRKIGYSKVVSIQPCGLAHTYDLTVPEAHNFVANNVILHNSIMVDNAGVTKNLSIIMKDYGYTMQDLDDANKKAGATQALVNGLLKETAIFAGDADKAAGMYQGTMAQLGTAFFELMASIGDFITKSSTVNTAMKNLAISTRELVDILKTAREFYQKSDKEKRQDEITDLIRKQAELQHILANYEAYRIANVKVIKTYDEYLKKYEDVRQKIAELTGEQKKASSATEDNTKKTEDNTAKQKERLVELEKIIKAQEDSIRRGVNEQEATKKLKEAVEEWEKITNRAYITLSERSKNHLEQLKKEAEAFSRMAEEMGKVAAMEDEIARIKRETILGKVPKMGEVPTSENMPEAPGKMGKIGEETGEGVGYGIINALASGDAKAAVQSLGDLWKGLVVAGFDVGMILKVITSLNKDLPALLFESIKSLLINVIAELPLIIGNIIPQLLVPLMLLIPDIFKQFAKNLPVMVDQIVFAFGQPETIRALAEVGLMALIYFSGLGAYVFLAMIIDAALTHWFGTGWTNLKTKLGEDLTLMALNTWNAIVKQMTASWNDILTQVPIMINDVFNEVNAWWQRTIWKNLTQDLGLIFQQLGVAFDQIVIQAIAGWGVEFEKSVTKPMGDALSNAWETTFATIPDLVELGFERGKDKLEEPLDRFQDMVDKLANALSGGGGKKKGTLGQMQEGLAEAGEKYFGIKT